MGAIDSIFSAPTTSATMPDPSNSLYSTGSDQPSNGDLATSANAYYDGSLTIPNPLNSGGGYLPTFTGGDNSVATNQGVVSNSGTGLDSFFSGLNSTTPATPFTSFLNGILSGINQNGDFVKPSTVTTVAGQVANSTPVQAALAGGQSIWDDISTGAVNLGTNAEAGAAALWNKFTGALLGPVQTATNWIYIILIGGIAVLLVYANKGGLKTFNPRIGG